MVKTMKTIKNNLIITKYVLKFCPGYLFFSILYILSNTAIGLAEVILIEKVIDLVISFSILEKVIDVIIKYLIVIVICSIIQNFYTYYLRHRYRHLWIKKIQHLMFSKAAQLDIESFDDPKTYDLFSKALKEGDLKGIDSFDAMIRFFTSITSVASLGTYIIFQDIWLLFMVIGQSLVSYLLYSRSNMIWYKSRREQEITNRKENYIRRIFYLEQYAGDLKTSNIDELFYLKRYEVRDDYEKGYRKAENTSYIFNCIEDIFYQVIRNLGGYAYLMWKVYTNKISIGLFSSTVNAVFKFNSALYQLTYSFTQLRDNALYINDFLWLLDYVPKVEVNKGKAISDKHPMIEIQNLRFKYPNQENYALHNINMIIKPQEKIAIIGYNGAGKSTLIKLLLKLYNPTEGKILMNNCDYQELNEQNLRKSFSSTFQNYQIYSVSVLENVLLRKRINEEDDEKVWNALEKAGLAKKIKELPKGLDTILTKEFDKEGLVLSGGEAQKLAIARIFASDAPIIILDEPTSSLDPLMEYEINKQILDLCTEKTIILISHRLSTVVDASKIYLFASGEIVEEGNHHELMKKKGLYYQMFETQAKLYYKTEEV